MATVNIPSFTDYDLESFVDDLETFMKANLNDFITKANTDKSGPDLDSVDSSAYYFQTIAEGFIQHSPFVFYGETDVSSEGSGPETLNTYTFQIAVIMTQGNEASQVLGKRLLRYRKILEEMFEQGWNSVNNRVKVNISGISPFPFQVANANNLYVGIGINLEVTLD